MQTGSLPMISSRSATVGLIVILCSGCRGPSALPPSVVTDSAQRQAMPEELYVSDPTADAVLVYDAGRPGSDPMRRITDGIDGPGGLALDSMGNLYVADTRSNRVTVYARGSGTPKQTYSDGLSSPVDVALDASNDLFVANFASFTNLVVEYPAGSDEAQNAVDDQCSCFPTAIAQEPNGDLLAAYNTFYAQTTLYRYSPNRKDGNPLHLSFGEPTWEAAGMIVAPDKDLVVARTAPGAILVFAPGGGSPKHVFDRGGMPRMLAADFNHSRLFVADQAAAHVAVLAYPEGKQLGTFSSGLRSVYGVAFDGQH
jgi:hypothetical protein